MLAKLCRLARAGLADISRGGPDYAPDPASRGGVAAGASWGFRMELHEPTKVYDLSSPKPLTRCMIYLGLVT